MPQMVGVKSAINFNEANKSLITALLTLLCLGTALIKKIKKAHAALKQVTEKPNMIY